MKNTAKIIFYTLLISTTIISVAYKSVLGAFGLGVESIETLAKLKNTQKTVQQMKDVHNRKKKNVKSKYLKRAKNKLASAGGGAVPVFGTIIVAGAVVKFSIDDYCEDQKLLIEEENILNETQIEFSQSQCWSSVKNEFYDLVTGNNTTQS